MKKCTLFIISLIFSICLLTQIMIQNVDAHCCVVGGCTYEYYKECNGICPMGEPYFCHYLVYLEECTYTDCITQMNCMTTIDDCSFTGNPVRRGGLCEGERITLSFYQAEFVPGWECDDVEQCFDCPGGGIPRETKDWGDCPDL